MGRYEETQKSERSAHDPKPLQMRVLEERRLGGKRALEMMLPGGDSQSRHMASLHFYKMILAVGTTTEQLALKDQRVIWIRR